MMPGCVIAVIQQKGGVGKSTICANLAAELSLIPASVIALDLDAQHTLTAWAEAGAGGALRQLVRPVEVNGHDRVRVFLAAINEARQDADFVLLDCPAGMTEAGTLATIKADVALIPVTPSPADIFALQDDIVHRIVAVLAARVHAFEMAKTLQKSAVEYEAYDLFLKARFLQQGGSKDGILAGRSLLCEAIARDSSFASAYAELSAGYLVEYESDWSNNQEAAGR